MNHREMTGLTGELKRGNDLIEQRIANANPIRTAIKMFNDLAKDEWDDLDLDEQLRRITGAGCSYSRLCCSSARS